MKTAEQIVVTHDELYTAIYTIVGRGQPVTDRLVIQFFGGRIPIADDPREQYYFSQITEALDLAYQGEKARALDAISPCVDAGSVTAPMVVGMFHERDGDWSRAEHWYRQAHDQGNLIATRKLGIMLDLHAKTARKAVDGQSFLRQAADAGDAAAQFHIVQGLREIIDDEPEYADEMVRWNRLAAAQDHVGAQFTLGAVEFPCH